MEALVEVAAAGSDVWVCVAGWLVCAKADTPNALPSNSAGRPKVFPDFIIVFTLLS
jgi:hypothetical protein